MSPENPNDNVTRADLDKQLEVHAKTIELQILLSQQQEKILEKLDEQADLGKDLKVAIEKIETRTWKQTWLFWGIIGSFLAGTVSLIVSRMMTMAQN